MYTGPQKCSGIACSTTAVSVTGLPDRSMTGNTVTQVAAGQETSCALLLNGSVYCWGSNQSGMLGTGSLSGHDNCGNQGDCATQPVKVEGITNAVQVSVGVDSACALLSNGHIDCWGRTDSGQLGSNSGATVKVG
jgi:alpha-tubulin suppressor-like RCC1 family protein